MKIRYTRQGHSDLDNIFTWLDERSPVAARGVKASIVASINRLAEHPLMAPATDEPGVRELTILRHPYKVYYEIVGDEVWILHIRHTAREPEK